jgi:hypothetical protein
MHTGSLEEPHACAHTLPVVRAVGPVIVSHPTFPSPWQQQDAMSSGAQRVSLL